MSLARLSAPVSSRNALALSAVGMTPVMSRYARRRNSSSVERAEAVSFASASLRLMSASITFASAAASFAAGVGMVATVFATGFSATFSAGSAGFAGAAGGSIFFLFFFPTFSCASVPGSSPSVTARPAARANSARRRNRMGWPSNRVQRTGG